MNSLTPISKQDIEICRSAIFASKVMKNQAKLRKNLKDRFRQDPANFNNAMSLGILSILPSDSDDPLDRKDALEDAVEAFEAVIEHNPRHWLSLFYKVRMQSMFADYYGEEEEVMEEIKELILIQNQSEYQPYFVLPYLLMVDMMLNTDGGDREEALQYLELAEKLPSRQVKELPDLLGPIFISLENKLRASGEDQLADRIQDLGENYFPEAI